MPKSLKFLFPPMIPIRIATFVRPEGGYLKKRAFIGTIGVVALIAGVQDVYAQARPAGVNPGWEGYSSVGPVRRGNMSVADDDMNRCYGFLKPYPSPGRRPARRWPRCGSPRPLLLRPLIGEELLAAGEAVGLQEEAENDGAIGRHRLVLVAGWPPDELTRSAHAFVVLERALEHERLLQRRVLVQRHHRARIELEQRRGDTAVVGIKHLDSDARELGRLPRHVGDVEIARGQLRRVLGLDVGMHDLAGLR